MKGPPLLSRRDEWVARARLVLVATRQRIGAARRATPRSMMEPRFTNTERTELPPSLQLEAYLMRWRRDRALGAMQPEQGVPSTSPLHSPRNDGAPSLFCCTDSSLSQLLEDDVSVAASDDTEFLCSIRFELPPVARDRTAAPAFDVSRPGGRFINTDTLLGCGLPSRVQEHTRLPPSTNVSGFRQRALKLLTRLEQYETATASSRGMGFGEAVMEGLPPHGSYAPPSAESGLTVQHDRPSAYGSVSAQPGLTATSWVAEGATVGASVSRSDRAPAAVATVQRLLTLLDSSENGSEAAATYEPQLMPAFHEEPPRLKEDTDPWQTQRGTVPSAPAGQASYNLPITPARPVPNAS